jgi:D-alanyl-D-alanine carboxypeptidase
MHTTPPREEDADEPQVGKSPLRRRSSVEPPRRPKPAYNPQDLPGVPKIRRASLFLDPQGQIPIQSPHSSHSSPPTQAKSGQLRIPPGLEDEDADLADLPDLPAPPQRMTRNSGQLQRISQQRTRMLIATQQSQSSSAKLPAVQSPARQPSQPLPAQRSQRLPSQPLSSQPLSPAQGFFKGSIQRLTHSQPVVIMSSVLLLVLILGLTVVGMTHFQSPNVLPGSGSNGSTIMPTGEQPVSAVYPYELVIAPQDTDHPAPPVFATSAYLLDADTGATLYASNPFMHLPMMSTTKLMTAVLAVEKGNINQRITINSQIAHDVSQLSADSAVFGFKQGEVYTLGDMLYALFLVSGNDAAIAIADTIGGNMSNFVSEMNLRAQQLGLFNTRYMNPHGLQATGQYSSAHDLAILGNFALNMPLIHQISNTEIHTIPKGGNHPERIIVNGDQFLWWYPGANGGKTGYDGGSNFVQVISVVRNHHHLIGVVMHTNDWWTDMRDLMNWGFDTFTWVSPYNADLKAPIPFDNLWNYFVKDKPTNTVPTANQGRYYIYTGYSVSGPIMTYFDKNGGLKHFGYPTSLQTAPSLTVVSETFEQGTIQCNLMTKQCVTN